MTEAATHRSNLELLNELQALVADRPRFRLHVHPESAVTLMISVQYKTLSEHVQVVQDPACTDRGQGFIEEVTAEQWRYWRLLVGRRVVVASSELGTVTGTLLELDHRTATVDLGDNDTRYLSWITIAADGQP